ncbi:MAG: hypothetical protein F6K35_39550 [Okeania sp. SIO2H7]|nr:hypothetical protein [Okeania sp. SIO2H7]
MLFEKEKVSLAKASKIAGMNQIKFQTLLAHRGICIHYDGEHVSFAYLLSHTHTHTHTQIGSF